MRKIPNGNELDLQDNPLEKKSFQYERFCIKIRVETEVRAALKWLI